MTASISMLMAKQQDEIERLERLVEAMTEERAKISPDELSRIKYDFFRVKTCQ